MSVFPRMGQVSALWLLTVFPLCGCRGGSPGDLAAVDARVVLAARLTHGVGDDVLDAELLRDSTNAEILVRARLGVDSAAVAATRVNALVAANLLRREGRVLRTTVPIVLGHDRSWYDSVTRAWAQAALREVEAPLDTLVQRLTEQGWRAWAHHFIWSQVFDSQRLWAVVQRARVTPPLSPAATWVIYPEHPYKTGTNLFPGRIDTPWFLAVTWSPTHKAQLARLEEAADTFIAVVNGRPVSDSAWRSLGFLGLLGPDGKPAVPILRANDPLLESCRTLAQRWASAVQRALNSRLIAQRLEVELHLAWAMAYHDVSWSALADLVRLHLVPPLPAAGFEPPAHGSAVLVPADPLFLSVLRDSPSSVAH